MMKPHKKSHEMSIDEILKSIKQVIKDKDKNLEAGNTDSEDITNTTDTDDLVNKDAQNNQSPGNDSSLDLDKSSNNNDEILELTNILDNQDVLELGNLQDAGNAKKHHSNVTIEDIVIQIIRAEVQNWLNNNLPDLVTQIVEKELSNLKINKNKT